MIKGCFQKKTAVRTTGKDLIRRRQWFLPLLGIVFFITLLAQAASPSQAAAEPIKLRGVVEGFYGTPWTHDQRLDMLDFCRAKKLNAYIYAPKDDAYHRDKWREAYPPAKLEEFTELLARAKRDRVQLIFAISPGKDITYSGARAEADKTTLLKKLADMYRLGFRQFAIFFDDIDNKDALGQARLANFVNSSFIKRNSGCRQLIVVPTEYYLNDMRDASGSIKKYTESFSGTLDKDILVLYTGTEVCPDGIVEKTVDETNKIYGRKLGIWWNYPVNDYQKEKLALGPIDIKPMPGLEERVPAFFMNPMEKPELSKLALATGAEFALAPDKYDENKAWLRALQDQYTAMALPMMIVAGHSQRLENDWAHIGRQDARELQQLYDRLWEAMDKAEPDKAALNDIFKQLHEANQARIESVDILLNELPKSKLSELKPQLEQLRLMSLAEAEALQLLYSEDIEAQRLQVFNDKLDAIGKARSKAMLSDKAVWTFLQKAADRLKTK